MNPACCCTTCTDCACCCWRHVEPGDGSGTSRADDGCIFAGEEADVCCGRVFDFTMTILADVRVRAFGGVEKRNLLTGTVTFRLTTTEDGLTVCVNELLAVEELSNSMVLRTNVQSSPGADCVPGGFATAIPVPIEYVVNQIGTYTGGAKSAALYPSGCGSPGVPIQSLFCAMTPERMLYFVPDAIIGYTLQEGGYLCGVSTNINGLAGSIGTQPFIPGTGGSCNGSAASGSDTEAWSSAANLGSGDIAYQLRRFWEDGSVKSYVDLTASWSREVVEPCPCGCATEGGDLPAFGSCCLPSGDCIGSTKVVCTTLGGAWASGPCGVGLACPPPTGACCHQEGGACSEETRADCDDLGGNYLGDGTDCEDCPPMGACCVPSTGNCSQATEADCDAAEGIWYEGLPCDDPAVLDCGDTTGACCLPDGTCVSNTSAECFAAGGFFSPGVLCATVDCTMGACCCPTSHGWICTTLPAYLCTSPDCTFSPGENCDTFECPGIGFAPVGGGAPGLTATAGADATAVRGSPGARARQKPSKGCKTCDAEKGL